MAMSPQLNVAFNWLPAIFGGRQSARSVHFILAFGFLFFVFGHVFMVLTQGFFNNMRSMITGWYREKVSSSPAPIKPSTPARPDIAKALNAEAEPPHVTKRNSVERRQQSDADLRRRPCRPEEKAQSDAPADETTEEKKT